MSRLKSWRATSLCGIVNLSKLLSTVRKHTGISPFRHAKAMIMTNRRIISLQHRRITSEAKRPARISYAESVSQKIGLAILLWDTRAHFPAN